MEKSLSGKASSSNSIFKGSATIISTQVSMNDGSPASKKSPHPLLHFKLKDPEHPAQSAMQGNLPPVNSKDPEHPAQSAMLGNLPPPNTNDTEFRAQSAMLVNQ